MSKFLKNILNSSNRAVKRQPYCEGWMLYAAIISSRLSVVWTIMNSLSKLQVRSRLQYRKLLRSTQLQTMLVSHHITYLKAGIDHNDIWAENISTYLMILALNSGIKSIQRTLIFAKASLDSSFKKTVSTISQNSITIEVYLWIKRLLLRID